MWAYTNLRLPSCSSMLQHKFIFTLPVQTLPGISTLFLCLSVCPSFSIFQSHREFPFYFPHSIPLPTATLRPPRSEGGVSVACNYAGKISMNLWVHFQQRTELYFVSSIPDPKAVENCSMLTTAVTVKWAVGERSKGYRKPQTSWARVARSTDIFHCSTASAYLKDWRFWCRWFSGGEYSHNSLSQFFHRTATRPLFKSHQPKLHTVLVCALTAL